MTMPDGYDLPGTVHNSAYKAGLEDQVDRWTASDPHLDKLSEHPLAAQVADEIWGQNRMWRDGLRGLAPLTPQHFVKPHYPNDPGLTDVEPVSYSNPSGFARHIPPGRVVNDTYDRFDEQLYTYHTEFANPQEPNSVAFEVYTDNRNTKTVQAGGGFTAIPLEQPTPIAHLGQYRLVAERRLDPYVKGCQLNLSYQCSEGGSSQLFAYKRGEFVFISKCCKKCISLFRLEYSEWNLTRPVGWQES